MAAAISATESRGYITPRMESSAAPECHMLTHAAAVRLRQRHRVAPLRGLVAGNDTKSSAFVLHLSSVAVGVHYMGQTSGGFALLQSC